MRHGLRWALVLPFILQCTEKLSVRDTHSHHLRSFASVADFTAAGTVLRGIRADAPSVLQLTDGADKTFNRLDVGLWMARIDSGEEHPAWASLHWDAVLPGESALQVRARCAPSESGLLNAAWGPPMTSPGKLNCRDRSGRWTEVEVRFFTHGGFAGPALKDMSVHWDTAVTSAVATR